MLKLLTVLLRSPSIPAPVATPPPAGISDEEKEAARLKEAGLQRRRRGRRSTLLTGGTGVTDQAPTATKTLLGQ